MAGIGYFTDESDDLRQYSGARFDEARRHLWEAANAEALRAPLLVQIEAVQEYLGEDGVELTEMGELGLNDAHMLSRLFNTDDSWAPYVDGDETRPFGSSNDLPHLQYLLEVAITAGAIIDDCRRMTPVDSWHDIEPMERCATLLSRMLDVGLGQRLSWHSSSAFNAMERLLSPEVLRLLVPAFEYGEAPYDLMLDSAEMTVRHQLGDDFPRLVRSRHLRESVDGVLRCCIDALERCGMVRMLEVGRRRPTMAEIWAIHSGAMGGETEPRRYLTTTAPGSTVVMGDLGRMLLVGRLDLLVNDGRW